VWLAIVLLVGALSLSASAAVAGSCFVRNPDRRDSYSSLSKAIHEARSGNTLRISGRCTGVFTVSKHLTLRGADKKGYSTPTLDGAGKGTVLTVGDTHAKVVDLRITGGAGSPASGVVNSGTLTLAGSTAVVKNGGSDTYGAVRNTGHLIMLDASTVKLNTGYSPAGIGNDGTLEMWDSSSVADNTTPSGGGGIWNTGITDLHDSASVTGNVAQSDAAGGIGNTGGTVNLRDSSLVSGNTAGNYGGGVFMDINSAGVINLYGAASITNNTSVFDGGGLGLQFTSTATVNVDPGWTGVITGNSPDNCYPDNVVAGCT